MSNCENYVSEEDIRALKESEQHIEHVARSRNSTGDKALSVTDTIRDESVTNRTLDGLEKLYTDKIESIGYQQMGDYATGINITGRDQIVFYDGSWYMYRGELPHVTAGATLPEDGGIYSETNPDGLWVDIGDGNVKDWVTENFEMANYLKIQSASFESGSVIENRKQVLKYNIDGFYYQYIGSSQLPIEVPENSMPDSNWRCVGDASYPTTVESYGADGSGIVDSSKAFQLMFDNFRGITLKYKMKYLIDKPVPISGNYLIIQGNKSELIKKTSTKSNLPLIEVYGGFVSGNVNCFFIGKERCSYVDIDGLTFDAREAPAADRPSAFYFPQITNYSIKNIDTRGCKHSLHVRSSWIGNLSNFRGNESTSHDFYYDSTRLNEDGSEAPTVQSGTSLTLDGVYSNAPKGNGFHFEKLDYSNFILTACDHPTGVPYNLLGCRGVSGTIGAESFNAEMIIAKDSTLNLTINTYAEGSAIDSYIFDFDNVVANLHGYLRLTQTKLVNAKNKTYCETNLSYWNGSTSALPASTSDSTSIVKSVSLNKSSEFEYDEVDSKYGINIVKGGTPYLGDALPPRLGSYTSSVFKCGFSGSQNVFLIPLDYIKRVLPSFNSANSEVFTISVSQGIKYSYGTTFVVNNGVLTLDMSNQKVSNDPNIGVSAISIYQTYLSVTTKAAFNNVTITIKPL